VTKLLILLFIFVSCEEKELEEIREQKLNSSSETSVPPGNNSQNIQCNAFSILKLQCSDQKINSISATQNRVCNSSGTNLSDTACLVQTCKQGFNIKNNECVPRLCTPNLTTNVNCKNEIAYSKTAIKQITCNETGTGISASICELGQCDDAYYKSGDTCIPKTCVANQNTQAVCTGSIPNAKLAVKNQFCGFDNQVSLGACLLKTCNTGYQRIGNNCAPEVCSPTQAPVDILCNDQIPNAAIAYITRTCNQYGSGELNSPCTLNSCKSGYFQVANTCVLEGSGGGVGTPPGTTDFYGVADLQAPSQIKMTCKDWLAENGINSVRPDQVKSLLKNRSTLVESTNRIARCAYILKQTQNGVQNSFCTSLEWDNSSSFQTTYSLYEEIIPVDSCNEENGSLLAVHTKVFRLSSSIGPARTVASNSSILSAPAINNFASPSQFIFTSVKDLNPPSKKRMTCEDWLIENGVNPVHQDEIRSIHYNLITGNGEIPKAKSCAYLVKRTKDGLQQTFCEPHGVDIMSFQGTFNLYDEVIPVPSCLASNQANVLIETNIFRDSSAVGVPKLLLK
jgi:hypothetical protein